MRKEGFDKLINNLLETKKTDEWHYHAKKIIDETAHMNIRQKKRIVNLLLLGEQERKQGGWIREMSDNDPLVLATKLLPKKFSKSNISAIANHIKNGRLKIRESNVVFFTSINEHNKASIFDWFISRFPDKLSHCISFLRQCNFDIDKSIISLISKESNKNKIRKILESVESQGLMVEKKIATEVMDKTSDEELQIILITVLVKYNPKKIDKLINKIVLTCSMKSLKLVLHVILKNLSKEKYYVDSLLKILSRRNIDSVMKLDVIKKLDEVNDDRFPSVLLKTFISSRNLKLKIYTARLLGRIKYKKASASLDRIVKDTSRDSSLRITCIKSLILIGHSSYNKDFLSRFLLVDAKENEPKFCVLISARGYAGWCSSEDEYSFMVYNSKAEAFENASIDPTDSAEASGISVLSDLSQDDPEEVIKVEEEIEDFYNSCEDAAERIKNGESEDDFSIQLLSYDITGVNTSRTSEVVFSGYWPEVMKEMKQFIEDRFSSEESIPDDFDSLKALIEDRILYS
jgi:hypothetical protein